MDAAVAAMVARQHGVISLSQLVQVGLSEDAVWKRVAAGRLHRVYPAVFALVPPKLLTSRGHWMAAVLACGEGAVLSHRSAAALHDLRGGGLGHIDVTSPGRRGRGIDGITAHRGETLAPQDVTIVEGIACTSVARTLVDLAEVLNRHALKRVCERAEMLGLFDRTQVEEVLARSNGRRGAPTLQTILDEQFVGYGTSRSRTEELFLSLCEQAGLPQPQVNGWIPFDDGSGVSPDFMWPDRRVIVEIDPYSTHGNRAAFARDRRKDQRLVIAGWRVVRFTDRQLLAEPSRVIATVSALLEG